MKYGILKNGNLCIYADADDKKRIAEIREEFSGLQDRETEALDGLICNSELMWIPEGACEGDLTSAPCLGIVSIGDREAGYREHELPAARFGQIVVGGDEGGPYYEAIVARWCYMDYQVRSFLDDLCSEKGTSEWQGGYASGQQFDHDPRFDEGGEFYAEANAGANLHPNVRLKKEVLQSARDRIARIQLSLSGDAFDKNEANLDLGLSVGELEVLLDTKPETPQEEKERRIRCLRSIAEYLDRTVAPSKGALLREIADALEALELK